MTDLNHLSFVLRFEAEIANETIKGRTANNLPIDDLMSVRNRKLISLIKAYRRKRFLPANRA